MKILHTADWHIGKKLHKQELTEDFDLFTKWLCECIGENEVDVLLVSGDIFDLANPSAEARRQYYKSLLVLRELGCKIILTGGNHDSPAMLDAPKHLLRELDLHVVGGLPKQLEDAIIPVYNQNNEPELVIAAIPFLRDSDLRWSEVGNTYEDRIENTRLGIQHIFDEISAICQRDYPGVSALAMGHLFAAGMQTSESERDIQIGNQAAFKASQFSSYFKYVALGHIHKPQQVSADIPIFYSGSPLPLSFSERSDHKRVLLIDTEHSWAPRSIPVPVFRKLSRISGSLPVLQEKLENLEAPLALESLLELELIEGQYDANQIYLLDQLVTNFEKPGYRIVKHRASFKNKLRGAADAYSSAQQLEDLKPKDIFLKLIEGHHYDQATRTEILSAFDELLEKTQPTEPLDHHTQ